jgi:hypothetical protein
MAKAKSSKQKIQFSYKERNGKMFVNPSELKPNPLNTKIYSNTEEEERTQQDIAKSFKERIENGQEPNVQSVVVYHDGLIDAGHTRWKAAKLAGCEIWVTISDSQYPDVKNKPYSALEQVTSTNKYRKITPSVKLNEFEEKNKAYALEFGKARSRKEEDKHLADMSIARNTMEKLQEIKSKRPELIPLIDSGEYTVKAAHDEATDKNKVKVIKSNNPDRDWSEIYDTNVFKIIMNRVANVISQMKDISYKLNGEIINPFNDYVKAAVTANISWMMESIGAEVLRGEGHKVVCASGHPTDPDIYHSDIDDKVEIKVTNFDGANTKWKGGQGIREGQYILVAYDEMIERWLVIFTKLTEKDWKSAGQAGHILPIKNVYDNHNKDMQIVYGEIYQSNGKLQVQLEKLK